MVQERIYNYFERNPQLHVLFIFDKLNINFTELELVEWKDNYIYKVFDGAWFNTKYAIENTWKDKRVVLLFTDGTYPLDRGTNVSVSVTGYAQSQHGVQGGRLRELYAAI